jgi:branched-subunit amino acid ABC-type transport system permease component
MRSALPFIVIGVTVGSVYALTALGLVLTYKTSGVFNFAHGALAALGAFTFYDMRDLHGLPWPLAAVLSLLLVGVVGGTMLAWLAKRLSTVPVGTRVVATVGLLIGIQAFLVIRYGTGTKSLDAFLPTRTVRFPGVNVGIDQILVVMIAAASAAGLFLFFKRSRLGLAMLAVVDDPHLLALQAVSPTAIRRAAWVIGSSFAALSGMLLAPMTGLEAPILTLLIVQAFGAAAIGAFRSLPLTYVGGLGVGIAAALSTRYLGGYSALRGLPASLPFVVLFVVLLAMPKGRLADLGTRLGSAASFTGGVSTRVPLPAAAATVGVLLLVPHWVGARLPVYTTALIFVMLFASLGLLVRTSGQVSLCHMAFAAVGAAVFGHLAAAGVPWPVAVLAGGVGAIPIGAVVAVPAIRLAGIYLAIATFGFGILVQRLFYTTSLMFGGTNQLETARPRLGGLRLDTDTGYYYVVLVGALLCIGVVMLVLRSRLGRLLRALADAPVALAAHGTNTNVTRVYVFCISAFLAGLAGALSGPVTGRTSGLQFDFFASLVLLAVLWVAGRHPIGSALVAAAAYVVVPAYITDQRVSEYLPLLFGISATTVAVLQSSSLGQKLLGSRRTAERVGRSPLVERRVLAAEGTQ